MKDLFDVECPDVPVNTTSGPYKAWKAENRYRPCEDKERRCKTCVWSRYKEAYKKRYYKCELLGISSSTATDIRVNHVCDRWEKE